MPFGQILPPLHGWQCNLGDVLEGEGFARCRNADFLASNLEDIFFGGIAFLHGWPRLKPVVQACIEVKLELHSGLFECCCRIAVDFLRRGLNGLESTCEVRLFFSPTVVGPIALRDFTQITRSGRRDDEHFLAGALFGGKRGMQWGSGFFRQRVHHAAVEFVGPRIVELGSNGPHHRQILVVGLPQIVVALELLPDIPQRVLRTTFVEFVDGNDVRKVEHVNFLELRGRAKLRGHDVERHIAVIHDFGVTLSNATRFKNHQVKGCRFQDVHGFLHMAGQRKVGLPCGQRPHVHPV